MKLNTESQVTHINKQLGYSWIFKYESVDLSTKPSEAKAKETWSFLVFELMMFLLLRKVAKGERLVYSGSQEDPQLTFKVSELLQILNTHFIDIFSKASLTRKRLGEKTLTTYMYEVLDDTEGLFKEFLDAAKPANHNLYYYRANPNLDLVAYLSKVGFQDVGQKMNAAISNLNSLIQKNKVALKEKSKPQINNNVVKNSSLENSNLSQEKLHAVQQTIEEKESTLNELQQQIQEREKKLSDLNQKIEMKEATLVALEQPVQNGWLKLQALQQMVLEKQRILVDLQQEVIENESKLLDIRLEADRKEGMLNDFQRSLEQHNEALQAFQQQLQQRESKLQDEINSKDLMLLAAEATIRKLSQKSSEISNENKSLNTPPSDSGAKKRKLDSVLSDTESDSELKEKPVSPAYPRFPFASANANEERKPVSQIMHNESETTKGLT